MAQNSSNPRIRCQCGSIDFHASQPEPIDVYFCHCTQCQKQSASAFGVSAIFPAEGMWPPPGDVLARMGVWPRITKEGNTLECYFCRECGVRILHRSLRPDGTAKPLLSVKGGAVEGVSFDGAKHIWTRTAKVPVPENSFLESPPPSP